MPSRRTCQQAVSCLASLLFVVSVLLVAVGSYPSPAQAGMSSARGGGSGALWWGIRCGRPVSDVVDAGDLG